MIVDLATLLRLLMYRRVRVFTGDKDYGLVATMRGFWEGYVPGCPGVETPALWLTGIILEHFIPFAEVTELETVDA